MSAQDDSQFRELWDKVQQNHKILDACKQHQFHPAPKALGAEYKCLSCGGTMKLPAIGWYIRGFVAAGGSSNDIWLGW